MHPDDTTTTVQRTALSVPLRIESPIGLGAATQPVTFGVPFAEGALRDARSLCLKDATGRTVPVQTEALARWWDGSVKWLLVDFLLDGATLRASSGRLLLEQQSGPLPEASGVNIHETDEALFVDTGALTFQIDRPGFRLPTSLISQVCTADRQLADSPVMRASLTDRKGRRNLPVIEKVEVETPGPLRTTVRLAGNFPAWGKLQLHARLCFFASTGLLRLRATIHNPNRAKHPHGLWDLGDRGSVLFRSLLIQLNLAGQASRVACKSEPEKPPVTVDDDTLEIYQDSSGGENWQSRNHVNRQGRVPCCHQGYWGRTCQGEQTGLRAAPVVAVENDRAQVTVALPEFWQQFPKAINVDNETLSVGLFPKQWDDLFELQGGEQKTHTAWFHFGLPEPEAIDRLDWVHCPARVVSTPQWNAQSGVFPCFLPDAEDTRDEGRGTRDEGRVESHSPPRPSPDDRLHTLLDGAIRGPKSLLAGREVIDQYGWRNYGDVFADHEGAYYNGPQPVISHYNNQFDVVWGAILEQMRTGDGAWSELFDPLARHVVDIDIYHTTRDRPAYNGGLFWFTDHYLSAETCTHRTYSRANRPGGRASCGGGPGAQHNFSTGLLHYYYLTGDREARRAVLGLADWVIAMDDGSKTVLGLIDDSPTGLASATHDADYHGPGRGSGNSINTLLDAWLVSGRREYLDKAEALVRRSIHPHDDVEARDLLDAEHRWSYTVFLSVLARYLDLKTNEREIDFMCDYAQSSLVHYARWILANERPYFDHPEELEYPTEAWAAQEFRKANVLRLAARHADEPLRRELLNRGNELSERAWSDLLRFDTRGAARAVAILMVEGPRDSYWREKTVEPAPHPSQEYDFGKPQRFVPQRRRVLARLKTVSGLANAMVRLAKPANYGKILRFALRCQ